MKKIAILCNYQLLPERVGGMDHFFWQFDAKCKANGIDVDWFFPNKAQHGAYKSLTIFDCKNKSIESFFVDFCIQKKPSYSHIITHFIELCTPFFKKIKPLTLAKIIAIDHNPRPINGYPIKKKIQKKIKGFLYSQYIDQFIGVSDYTVRTILNDFGKALKNKTKTIYNGVLLADIKVRTDRKKLKPTFIVVSHLRESKGIQDLIVAVSKLSETILKEIHFTIYGDGPYEETLRNLTKACGVVSNFSFMGSQSNLEDLYCMYDYMVQPTHMECFSLSILESLAANVPVITTAVGGNTEAVANGGNGYIFKAKAKDQLAFILENIFLGTMQIQTNTREVIQNKFSLEGMVQQHFELVKM